MSEDDWSAEPSRHTVADDSAGAVDLLRRLGVVESGERLNNAGALLFVPGDRVLLDYKRRKASTRATSSPSGRIPATPR